MTHLDEGTLVALRDSHVSDATAEEHLGGCRTCGDALHDAKRRAGLISEALASLDGPVDVLGGKASVRRRLDAGRARQPRLAWWRTHLGRAAALLVLTAGAASALPGSPVREWWSRGDATSTAAPPAIPEPTPAAQGAPAGISVAVPDGRITVVVRGAEPGTTLEVTWVDRLAARISAAPGSGFTYADGRAEVDAAPGPIRIELPRSAAVVTLQVGDRVFLERSSGRLDVSGPATERSESGIRFVVPAI